MGLLTSLSGLTLSPDQPKRWNNINKNYFYFSPEKGLFFIPHWCYFSQFLRDDKRLKSNKNIGVIKLKVLNGCTVYGIVMCM